MRVRPPSLLEQAAVFAAAVWVTRRVSDWWVRRALRLAPSYVDYVVARGPVVPGGLPLGDDPGLYEQAARWLDQR